eukprot:sb/3465537/
MDEILVDLEQSVVHVRGRGHSGPPTITISQLLNQSTLLYESLDLETPSVTDGGQQEGKQQQENTDPMGKLSTDHAYKSSNKGRSIEDISNLDSSNEMLPDIPATNVPPSATDRSNISEKLKQSRSYDTRYSSFHDYSAPAKYSDMRNKVSFHDEIPDVPALDDSVTELTGDDTLSGLSPPRLPSPPSRQLTTDTETSCREGTDRPKHSFSDYENIQCLMISQCREEVDHGYINTEQLRGSRNNNSVRPVSYINSEQIYSARHPAPFQNERKQSVIYAEITPPPASSSLLGVDPLLQQRMGSASGYKDLQIVHDPDNSHPGCESQPPFNKSKSMPRGWRASYSEVKILPPKPIEIDHLEFNEENYRGSMDRIPPLQGAGSRLTMTDGSQ